MHWKEIDPKIIRNFIKGVNNSLKDRAEQGIKKYDTYRKGFQSNDVLEDLEQELLDALFYLHMAKREREYLKIKENNEVSYLKKPSLLEKLKDATKYRNN